MNVSNNDEDFYFFDDNENLYYTVDNDGRYNLDQDENKTEIKWRDPTPRGEMFEYALNYSRSILTHSKSTFEILPITTEQQDFPLGSRVTSTELLKKSKDDVVIVIGYFRDSNKLKLHRLRSKNPLPNYEGIIADYVGAKKGHWRIPFNY